MTVKIEAYQPLHILILGVIVSLCVGGIDLLQWKQGNTRNKSILKDLSLRDLFFWGFLEIHIKF